jgi:NhaA family Na+:H+ antiporter
MSGYEDSSLASGEGQQLWGTTPPLVRVLASTQKLFNRAALSSILMMLAAAASFGLANSPLEASYQAVLSTDIGISFDTLELKYTLAEWINDGLLAIYFLWLGLTIKREVRFGTVASTRAIILPTLAALGGVSVPAPIYVVLNLAESDLPGWGIPGVTDITLTLGALALLGARIPLGLKVFLAAVAIVDNLIAVLVIAIFYSGAVDGAALGMALLVFALLLFANDFGVRNTLVYVVSGFVIIVAFMQSGVHTAVAGLLVACAVPPGKSFDMRVFVDRTYVRMLPLARDSTAPRPMQPTRIQQAAINEFRDVLRDVQAPLSIQPS